MNEQWAFICGFVAFPVMFAFIWFVYAPFLVWCFDKIAEKS